MMTVPCLLFIGWTACAQPLIRFSSGHEIDTMNESLQVLHAMTDAPLREIPRSLLQDARGVAVIPNVLKAGLVVGARRGRGVVLNRNPDGSWSNPIFVTLTGGSIGWQIGVQSADIVLVFKTRNSLDRILGGKGKITLGGDVAIAAGPVGRQAEAGTDARLKAEIYSYARSRGLFIGLSLEGAGLWADHAANAAFYGTRTGHPAEVLALQAIPLPAATLKNEIGGLTAPPILVHPPQLVPLPPPPPPAAPQRLPQSPVPVNPAPSRPPALSQAGSQPWAPRTLVVS